MSADALAEVARIEAAAAALRSLLTPAATLPAGGPVAGVPAPARGLAEPARFFDYVRTRAPLGPKLVQAEVDGCQRILAACAAAAWPVSWAAYGLATEFHETAGQMRPIREYGRGAGKAYGKPGRNKGQIPYGRGDVQLTWDDNYEAMDAELGLGGALIADYDLALDPEISARIMVVGMEKGVFTKKGLGLYLPAVAERTAFVNARRVVNGTDKAELIAGYALTFQTGLQAGGWR